MTKAELTGPGAAAFWLATLEKADNTHKRDFLTLADAAGRLGCQPDALLDQGLSGALALYAPVLQEGLYVWPVTARGVPFTSLLGQRDGVTPIFQARLQYGEYAVLAPDDVKRIKIEQAVRPKGYICPERVRQQLAEWAYTLQDEQAPSLVKRIEARATTVAWIPAFPEETEGGVINLNMLRVDSSAVPLQIEQPKQPTPDAQQQAAESAPVLLLTSEAIKVFEAQLKGVAYGKRKIESQEDWEKLFKKPSKKLLVARKVSRQGVEARWNPVDIGIWLRESCACPWVNLNRAFKTGEKLQPWRQHWINATKFRGNEDVEQTESDFSTASPWPF